MTAQLPKERLKEIAEDGFVAHGEIKAMARALLAAYEKEPVAYRYRDNLHTDARFSLEPRFGNWSPEDISEYEISETPLYDHPAPSIPAVAQPVMFIDGDISSEDAEKLAKVIREFNEEDERPLAKMARIIRENPHPTNECDMLKNKPAPSIPAVPDEMPAGLFGQIVSLCAFNILDKELAQKIWNACRAAMLKGGKS